MAGDPRVADFGNRMLKLETAEAVEELFADLDSALVERIVLTGNTVGVPAAKALGRILGNMPRLKVARLNSIFITRSIDEIPQALQFICDGLCQCTNLLEVDLSSNAFGVRSVQPVVPLLSNCLSLEVVKLMNNGLNSEGGRVVANALLASAKKSKDTGRIPNLRVLILSRNRLEDESASAWGQAIAAYPRLQRFEIKNAGLEEAGIIALADGLLHCPDLRRLRLCDNTIAKYEDREGTRGWKAIANVIRAAKNLEYLDVSSCALRTDGCAEIISALGQAEHPRLHSVRLDNNDFSEEHYPSLGDAVESLPALTSLNLAFNEDLEDNTVVLNIRNILEGRGGQLELDDDDDDDGDGEGGSAEEQEQEEPKPTNKEKSAVDDLADLISSKLAIDVT